MGMLPTGGFGKGKGRGFSLLEVIICLGLIATVLLVVFRLQAQNIDLQSEAMFIDRAGQLARERLTMIRTNDTLLPGNSSGDFGKNNPHYGFEEEVSPLPDVDNIYKISIRITFEEHKGTRDYRTTTYLFRVFP